MPSAAAKPILLALWFVMVAPAIGAASALLAGFPDSDAVTLGLFVGLPCILAVAGGAVARAGAARTLLGALLAPGVGLFVLLAILGATQSG
jgi:hypothetical protein